MTHPPEAICLTPSRDILKVDRTFKFSILSRCSSLTFTKASGKFIPVLFIRKSSAFNSLIRPKKLSVVTSSAQISPRSANILDKLSNSFEGLAAAITKAPRSKNARAIERPIPLLAPVIRTVLPENS